MNIFDVLYEQYKITKPIRLIELFGGYGSQYFALEYLGANFEHWKLCEWAVKSIQAYKDGHYRSDTTDYSKDLTKQELIDYLFKKQISQDYNAPMELKQISRQNETWLRTVYNNIQATKNTVDITQTKASDLEIVDTDKYDYIMTYSFPCQDLSLAGLGKGMARDSGTRSGMLWEVERILDECTELPQVLLMENVPEVKGTNNVKYFNEWQSKLESLGYKNYHQNLIATDYGIPQTRNRTFMISILGDYSYTFPNKIPLKLKLKDMLEDNVSEKYYLSKNAIKGMFETNYQQSKYENRVQKDICSTIMARDYKDAKCVEVFDYRYDEGVRSRVDTEICPTITCKTGSSGISGQPLLKIPEATKKEYSIEHDGDGVYINRPHQKRGVVQKDKMQTLKTSPDTGVVVNDNMKTKLCNTLIEKGMVKENDVIKHSYTSNKLDDKRLVPSHNVSPTLDTRADCLGVTTKEQEQLRIRKLTPKEYFRLMGVRDEDYERIAKNQSDSSLYHLAGDSIVVNVLMAIFGELLGE